MLHGIDERPCTPRSPMLQPQKSARPRSKTGRLVCKALLAGYLAIGSSAPSWAKDVIAEASRYTVKILSAVDYPFGGEAKRSGRGAGVLIDKTRGWILTNAHVAKRSPSTLRVSFKDQPDVPAKKIYVDSHLDIAVIRVDPLKIPESAAAADLQCGAEPVPGLPVIAFGHPWGLDYTATRGIVSGTKVRRGVERLQTDAALNPGNSGGPLVDEKTGIVIGINEARLSGAEGLNFAAPINFACTIIALLNEGKDPAPPIIPLSFATTFRERELVVSRVTGAWAGNIKVGDRILAVDGNKAARTASRVLDLMRGKDVSTITIRRDGKQLDVTVELPKERDHVRRLGVHVSGMTISKTTIPGDDPTIMFIHFVEPASIADQAQFYTADRVSSVDGVETKSHADVLRALQGKADKDVEFIIKRQRSQSSAIFDYFVRNLRVTDTIVIDESGVKR